MATYEVTMLEQKEVTYQVIADCEEEAKRKVAVNGEGREVLKKRVEEGVVKTEHMYG